MKHHGKIIIKSVLFGLISIGSAFAQVDPELYVMSYNVNADQTTWEAGRKDAVMMQIDAVDADVVALQEATSLHQADIAEAFSDKYEMVVFNEDSVDKVYQQNFEPILVRRDRVSVILSGTVEMPLACADEGVGDRVINWALLDDNVTGQQFMFYNNHFCMHDEHSIGVSANEMHAIMLSQLISVQKGLAGSLTAAGKAYAPVLPAIVAGSFNAHRAMSSVAFLLDKTSILSFSHDLDMVDTWEVAHPDEVKPPTRMGMAMLKADIEENAVDYMIAEPAAQITVIEAEVVAPMYMANEVMTASDHAAVTARLLF